MFENRARSLIVVGANGRVGRLLIPAFRALGASVALTHRGGGRLTADMAELTWAPTEGPAALVGFVQEHGVPAAMLVLAGSTPATGTDQSVNETVALASLAAARAAGIGRILLASSSAVYGRGRDAAWHEDDRPDPATAYGRAKLAAETNCAGPDVCALRIGNVAGADSLLCNENRPVMIDQFADGSGPQRSYIGPVTLARVLVSLAQTPAHLPPVVNVGASLPVDMADLARAAEIPFTWREAAPGVTKRLTLDMGRLGHLVPLDDREACASDIIAQWQACKTSRDETL